MASEAAARTGSSGIGLGGAVFLLFLALKLGVGHTQVQDWSWWWVTAPLWIPFAIFAAVVVIGLIIAFIAALFKGKR